MDAVEVRGVVATVHVTLRTPREQHSSELTLTAVPDGPLRALRGELQPVPLPMLTLEPRASTGVVLLNGQPVVIPPVRWSGRRSDRPSVTLHVLPVDYRPDRSARLAAQAVILTELFQCLRTGLARPPGCPIGVRLPADTPGRWQLLELPEIRFASMAGETVDYRGQGLTAQFLPAAAPAGDGDLPREGSRAHRLHIDFGVTLRRDGTDVEVQHWIYVTARPWSDEA